VRRGEVWWVSFDESIGGEIKKKRPAVIVSNDAANKFLNRIQVVPLTSKIERIYPSEAIVKFQGKESKAMADQLTTVSKERLTQLTGSLPQEDMCKIEKAIKLQLDLQRTKTSFQATIHLKACYFTLLNNIIMLVFKWIYIKDYLNIEACPDIKLAHASKTVQLFKQGRNATVSN